MSGSGIQSATEAAIGLTQWQRVKRIFFAPSDTFEDIKNGNRSWWMPMVLLGLACYLLFGAVAQNIGMQTVVDNQIRLHPRASERIAQTTPVQPEKTRRFWLGFAEVVFTASPALVLIAAALASALLLVTINFVFRRGARFEDIFTVTCYAWLPMLVKVLLGVAVICAGLYPESFNIKNYAPTNVGAFLDPTATDRAIYVLASSVDPITIWCLILMSMGVAQVSRVRRKVVYVSVFGWWMAVVLIQMGWAAIIV